MSVGQRALTVLASEMRANSEHWFPQLHDGNQDLVLFYSLGLCGEVGEVANVIKKLIRQAGEGDIALYAALAAELADVFTYLLLLADEVGCDLVGEYDRKVVINEERWGVVSHG